MNIVKKNIKNAGIIALLALTAFDPIAALAGTATLSGYGEARAKPDFVALKVTVRSDCYPTASGAVSANDAVAKQIIEIMKSYIKDPEKDQVTATGGLVERYTSERTPEGPPLCVQKFRKENEITLKTSLVSDFSIILGELQDKIYAVKVTSEPLPASPSDYIEIAAPQTGVATETLRALERKALAEALTDAKEKLKVTIEPAGIKSFKLVKYTENMISATPALERTRSSEGAPVEFGTLMLRKWLSVQFSFTGGDLLVP